MAVAGAAGKTKGVDSTAEPSHALEYAKQLAKDLGCIVAISGATDLVRSQSCKVLLANMQVSTALRARRLLIGRRACSRKFTAAC
jgi:hydroxyethylthiazole kinase-like sugar kinase family protein